MVSAVRKLTGVGGDVRQIARLLQKKAPPGHMLAYINQEEADLLKARGGSGKPHEDTGVPSFEDEYSSVSAGEPVTQTQTNLPDVPTDSTTPAIDVTAPSDTDRTKAVDYLQRTDPQAFEAPQLSVPQQYQQYGVGRQYADQAAALAGIQPTEAKADADLFGRAAKALNLNEESLKRLGIGGLQALVGGMQARQASQAGQAGKE